MKDHTYTPDIHDDPGYYQDCGCPNGEYHKTSCLFSDPDVPDFQTPFPTLPGGPYAFCVHLQTPYTLSNGDTVYLTAHNDMAYATTSETDRLQLPDLGVYLSNQWIPDCVAFHIGWPDFGTPAPDVAAVISIATTALSLAKLGKTVEIGCQGAHGRTGTFLAILDFLASEATDIPLTARAAVRRVRANYCQNAVEGKVQEWYVRNVYAIRNGYPTPSRPVAKPSPFDYTPTSPLYPLKPYVSPLKNTVLADLARLAAKYQTPKGTA